MLLRAPVLGGNFAVWGGLFSTFDCSYTYLRKKEDPWNSVAAGASTGGILAIRSGWKAFATGAVIGGVLLGMIEGLGIVLNKMMTQDPPNPHAQGPPGAQMAPSGQGQHPANTMARLSGQQRVSHEEDLWKASMEEFHFNFADEEDY